MRAEAFRGQSTLYFQPLNFLSLLFMFLTYINVHAQDHQMTPQNYIQPQAFKWVKDTRTNKDIGTCSLSKIYTNKIPEHFNYHPYQEYPIFVGEPVELYAKSFPEYKRKIPDIILEEQVRDLEYIWRIEKVEKVKSPENFKPLLWEFYGKHVTFHPSEPGIYNINLNILYNETPKGEKTKGVCHNTAFFIHVTMNPPLRNISAVSNQEEEPFKVKFSHLEALGVFKAWKLAPQKGEGILVAVIDTGFNYNAPDFAGKIANFSCKTKEDHKDPIKAQCEIPGNSIDDDNNGFTDDVHGWDFHYNDPYPFSEEDHGSSVAGLISSQRAGVAPQAKILPITPTTEQMSNAVRYAVDRKAHIINLSFSMPTFSAFSANLEEYQNFIDSLEYARKKGVLIVTTTGNSRKSNCILEEAFKQEESCVFTVPAKFSSKMDNVFAVAATTNEGQLTEYSMYNGTPYKTLAAPGGTKDHPIISVAEYNTRNRKYALVSGTSFASPLVVGTIALILSAQPQFFNEKGHIKFIPLFEVLKQSGITHPTLKGKIASERMLRADDAVKRALEMFEDIQLSCARTTCKNPDL